MIGIYILRELCRAPRQVAATLTAVAAIVTLLVVVDLGLRGLTERSFVALLSNRASDAASASSATPDTKTPSPSESAQVTRATGGSIRTPLAFGFVVAKGSSLQRE